MKALTIGNEGNIDMFNMRDIYYGNSKKDINLCAPEK